jgi:hypothetical protein
LTIEWPVLWVDTDDDLPQIGAPSLEWQGKPLDIPTIDEWTLQMGRGRFATLTVQVPVIVRTRPRPAVKDHTHPSEYDHSDDTDKDGHVHAPAA